MRSETIVAHTRNAHEVLFGVQSSWTRWVFKPASYHVPSKQTLKMDNELP